MSKLWLYLNKLPIYPIVRVNRSLQLHPLIFNRFLWVYLQLEELCEAPSELIGEVLRDLPEGLAETYRRILLKLQKSAWKTKIAAKAFRWIACAQRPLQVDELKEAIEYENSDTSWRNAASMDDEQLIRSFGALVCVDPEDRTIRFVHHTVLQFLFSTEEISPIFHFSQAQAHCFVGEMCVVYLSFSDFETSLTQRPPERKVQDAAIFQAGAMSTIPRVLGIGRSLFHVAYRLYGGKQATAGPPIDHDRLLNSAHKPMKSIEPVSSMLARKYRLLHYVVSYWDCHTKWLEEKNMAIWRLFRNLALNKSLPFEFRKWGLNEHYGSYGCTTCEPGSSDSASEELPFTTILHYAAQVGHVPLLRLFKDEVRGGLEVYLVHEPSRLLFEACFNDQEDVVEHLLHNYAEYVDGNSFREALHAAASSGHENTLCTLLPYASALEIDLSAALPNAIHQGKVSCVERLLTAGARFDVSISEHRAALNAAIKEEHDSTIAMLIQREQLSVIDVYDIIPDSDGVYVYLMDDLWGQKEAHILRGLRLAASRGLTLALKAMLDAGSAIDDKDPLDKTALHHAAEMGHSKAVCLLLEHNADANAFSKGHYENSKGHHIATTGLTALHLAAMGGHTDAVQILCEHGARVNGEAKEYGHTPLHLAARHGHSDTIRKLCEHGAYLNHEDRHGWMPLGYAIEFNKKDAETLLRELGAFANVYCEITRSR